MILDTKTPATEIAARIGKDMESVLVLELNCLATPEVNNYFYRIMEALTVLRSLDPFHVLRVFNKLHGLDYALWGALNNYEESGRRPVHEMLLAIAAEPVTPKPTSQQILSELKEAAAKYLNKESL